MSSSRVMSRNCCWERPKGGKCARGSIANLLATRDTLMVVLGAIQRHNCVDIGKTNGKDGEIRDVINLWIIKQQADCGSKPL